MWRYNFSKKNVEKAKKKLNGSIQVGPSFLNKFKGSIKKGNLYLDDKLVIPKEKEVEFIRKKVLSGRVPMSRDSLYYYLNKISVGVSRAAIDKFLKAQNIIRETDNVQASTKKASRKVHRKGNIEFDLVEINWKDVGFKPEVDWKALKIKPTAEDRKAGYVFTLADSLTGLLFAKFAPTKYRKHITPIAKEGFNYMAEKLDTPISKMHALADSGKEWDVKKYNTWGLRVKFVPRAPLIERKNSQFQAALYRIIKMKTSKEINKLVKQAQDVVNRTQSTLTKVAPVEALNKTQKELSEKYNKRRGAGSGVKLKSRVLKIGEFVRLNILKDKERGGQFYKAYKGLTWSKRRYPVLAKRGDRYKIDGPNGKKFYHRQDLKPTPPADKKTLQILHEREKSAEAKNKKEIKQIRKDIDKKAKASKRPKRAGAQAAKEKLRKMYDTERERDKTIGT